MPEPIVHLLEIVEVDEEYGSGLAAAPGLRDEARQLRLEALAIEDPGENVMAGQVMDLLFEALTGRDVLHRALVVGRSAGCVANHPGRFPDPNERAVEAAPLHLEAGYHPLLVHELLPADAILGVGVELDRRGRQQRGPVRIAQQPHRRPVDVQQPPAGGRAVQPDGQALEQGAVALMLQDAGDGRGGDPDHQGGEPDLVAPIGGGAT